MQEEPCRIDVGSGDLLGMLHLPDRPVGSVLFCNPLFEERKPAQRVLVEAARALCSAGWAVLRFDYRGCGDSAGEFESFSIPDWLADIRAADAWLRVRVPAGRRGVLGLRLGAALALMAAPEGGPPDFAVLWEPVPNGRAYLEQELRRKLMKEMMTFGRSRGSRDDLIRDLEQGREVDFDGHPVTPALYRDLATVELDASAGPLPARGLILGIGPAERPTASLLRTAARLGAAGMTTTVKAIREQPFWNLVGLVACPAPIRETVDWCRARGAEPGRES